MTKLKAAMTAAAIAFLGGGITIYQAFQQGAVSVDYTEQEWCRDAKKLNDVQRQEHFFVAIQTGATLPKAVVWNGTGTILQSDCTAGECFIAPTAGHECRYKYRYAVGPAVDGWRVADVWAHPRAAQGWKQVAAQQGDLKWFGGIGPAITACLAHTTPAKCKLLLDVDSRCWVWDTDAGEAFVPGDRCRHGNHMGVDEACTYNYPGQIRGAPCTVWRGAGSEDSDSAKEWTDEEMDEL